LVSGPRCPQSPRGGNVLNLIFVKPRFGVYKRVTLQVRAIFTPYRPIIEPLSLDEAYRDVTDNLKGIASATEIAKRIRAEISAGCLEAHRTD
jgi:DNA polymerase-4